MPSRPTPPTISVVGTGAVARAIARRHVDAGGRVLAIVSRDADRAEAAAASCGADRGSVYLAETLASDAVLVAVRDDAVPAVGRRIADTPDASQTVWWHTSGALSGAAFLDGLRVGGDEAATVQLALGSLHPLQAIESRSGDGAHDPAALASRLDGVHWFHEGAAPRLAAKLTAAWSGTLHSLALGSKSLYHAAAAHLSNHTVALYDSALRMLSAAGLDPAACRDPLLHLLTGTVSNLERLGVPHALTGPIARGDVDTVAEHVAALRAQCPEQLPSYLAMARAALDVAARKGGGTDEDRARILAVLERAQG